MLIKEIKQIIPASGVFATYIGEDRQIDKDATDPVILWAICVCQFAGETFDAILGFVSAAEEGLQPAEYVPDFLGYAIQTEIDK